MTSSARSRNDCGIAIPSAFAVFTLMSSSNLVAFSTGRSPRLGAALAFNAEFFRGGVFQLSRYARRAGGDGAPGSLLSTGVALIRAMTGVSREGMVCDRVRV